MGDQIMTDIGEITYITDRECQRCRETHEQSMRAIRASVEIIAASRAEDSRRIHEIGRQVDAIARDVATIQVTIEHGHTAERGAIRVAIRLLPWLIALLLGGGGLYRASQPPSPEVIREIIRQVESGGG